MTRVSGKRLQFHLEEGIYTAVIGNDRWAFLVQDSFGWRAILWSPDARNPVGLYLSRDYWRHDRLQKAVLNLERMINKFGSPRFGQRDERGTAAWYGETQMLTGPLLDGSGHWMKLGSTVVTIPPRNRKRRKLVPDVGKVPFHPLVMRLQAAGCALNIHLQWFQEAVKLDHRLEEAVGVGCGLLVENCKRRLSTSLESLLRLTRQAEEEHVPWRCHDILAPELAKYVDEARDTGSVTVTI
jgi:hypothetical protein